MADWGTEVWRGGVNPWECDDMAHLNTRFYVARATEALPVLFAQAGLPGLFAPGRGVTVQDMHIRFHREARVGTPLHMTAAFSAVGPDAVEVAMLLYHSRDGAVAAGFRLRRGRRLGGGAGGPAIGGPATRGRTTKRAYRPRGQAGRSLGA